MTFYALPRMSSAHELLPEGWWAINSTALIAGGVQVLVELGAMLQPHRLVGGGEIAGNFRKESGLQILPAVSRDRE